jgi:hypothetical protein
MMEGLLYLEDFLLCHVLLVGGILLQSHLQDYQGHQR